MERKQYGKKLKLLNFEEVGRRQSRHARGITWKRLGFAVTVPSIKICSTTWIMLCPRALQVVPIEVCQKSSKTNFKQLFHRWY